MAGELTTTAFTLAYTKANTGSTTVTVPALSITVTGGGYMDNVQSIGTTEEAILLGDITAGGWYFVQNLDATNFVSLRQGTATANMIQLLAGEWCLFRMSPSTAAPFAIADTGAVLTRFLRIDL